MFSYLLYLAVIVGELTLLAIATDLLAGHAGRTGVGAILFAGIGSYSFAILATRLGCEPYSAVGLSVLISAVVALLLGALLVRLDADAFLIATVAIQVAFVNLTHNSRWSGGPLGISNVPAPAATQSDGDPALVAVIVLFLVCLSLFVYIGFCLRSFSRRGVEFHALRDDRRSALAAGLPIQALLLSAFVFHGAIGSVAGISATFARAYVGPQSFDLGLSLAVFAVVFLGGTGGRPWWMLVSAALFVVLSEAVVASINRPEWVGPVQQILFNSLLVLVIVFRRRGLGGPHLEDGSWGDAG